MDTTLPPLQPINQEWYTVIIHVCDQKSAGSNGPFEARLNSPSGSTVWVEFGKKGLDKDGLYIFHVDAATSGWAEYGHIFFGSVVESIDFAATGDDPVCIDMVTAGQASQPDKFAGSSEVFWLGNPCPYYIDECYEYHSVSLDCYQ